MGQDTWLFVTLWLASGAFIGGVVTPLLASGRQFNDWLSMILGTGLGAVGNVILLIPLWGIIMAQKVNPDTQPQWHRDAGRLDGLLPEGEQVSARDSFGSLGAVFKANFWPSSGLHSHRLSYVGVFAALAVITFAEVAVTYTSLPFSRTPLLVALSSSKVLLVAMFFMHLRYDSRWYTAIFTFGVPFAALVVTILALSTGGATP